MDLHPSGGSVTSISTGTFTGLGGTIKFDDGSLTVTGGAFNAGGTQLTGNGGNIDSSSGGGITVSGATLGGAVTLYSGGDISFATDNASLAIGLVATPGANITIGNTGGNISINAISTTGTLTINSPGTIQLDDDMTLGNFVLQNAGGNATTSKNITVSGNWTNNGTGTNSFNATGGTVTFTGGGTSTINGDNRFSNLTCTAFGTALLFEAGKTQWVNGTVTFTNVTLNSTSTSRWILRSASANTTITGTAISNGESYNSLALVDGTDGNTDSGNNIKFFVNVSGYVWTGSNNTTNWLDDSNWNTNEAPPVLSAITDITIPDVGTNNYPVLTFNTQVRTMLITGAAASLDLANNNFTATTTFNNAGTLKLHGTTSQIVTLPGGGPPGGTVEYYGGGAATNKWASYVNLTINKSSDSFTAPAAVSVTNATVIKGAGTVAFDGLLTTPSLDNSAASTANILFNGGVTVSGGVTTFSTSGTLTMGVNTATFAGGVTRTAATGPTVIAGTVATNSAAAIALNTAVTLSVASNVTTSNGAITFGGTVNGAQTLTVNAGSGTVTFSGVVGGSTPLTGLTVTGGAVTEAAGITATGNISLTGTGLTLTGALNAGTANVSLTTTGVTAAIAAPQINGGVVTLTATGAITQSGVITATASASFTAAGGITLNTFTNVTSSVSFTNTGSGNIAFTNSKTTGLTVPALANTAGGVTITESSGALTVTPAVSAGGAVSLTAAGALTAGAVTTTAAGNITLGGSSLTLSGALNANSGGSNVSLTTTGATAGIAAPQINGGVVTLTATGAITQSGVITATASASFTAAGGITLNTFTNVTSSVSFTNTGSGNIAFTNSKTTGLTVSAPLTSAGGITITESSGALTVTPAVSAGGAVSLTAAGALTASGDVSSTSGAVSLTAAGALATGGTVSSASGNIALAGSGVTTGGSITATSGTIGITGAAALGADVTLAASGNISIGSTINAATHSLTLNSTGGDITFGGDITSLVNFTLTTGTVSTTANITLSGNWTNSGTFAATGGTVEFTGDGTVSGENGFYNLTCAGHTLTLPAQTSTGITQTIDGMLTLTNATLTSSAAGDKTDKETWFNINVTASAANVAVTNTTISYGQSVNDLRGADLVGGVASNSDGAAVSTLYFFKRLASSPYIWDGTTDATWNDTTNWELDDMPVDGDTANAISIPVVTTFPVLNVNWTAGTITIGSSTLPSASLDVNGKSLTLTALVNSGTVRLQGTETLGGTFTKTNNTGSIVEYYGTATATEIYGASYQTLQINMDTGGSWSTSAALSAVQIDNSASSGNVGGINFLHDTTITGDTTSTFNTTGTVTIDDGVTISNTGSGSIAFSSSTPVALATGSGGVTISLTSADASDAISFGSTIDGDNALTVNAGSGAVTFGGVVGGTTSLTSLAVTGATTIDTATITTTVAQTYNSAVTLATGATLTTTDSAVSFSSTIDGTTSGTESLTIAAGTGTVTFGGVVGATTSLTSLAVTGAATINTTAITTTGTQTYTGAVTLGADVTLTTTNSNVSFTSTIDGTTSGVESLTVAAGSGVVTFDGAVGVTMPPASLEVTGPTAINTTAITTTDDQTYNSAVTLGADVTFTGGSANLVYFKSTVEGAASDRALVIATADVRFDSAVSGNMASVSVAGTTAINTTAITTTGTQTYTGAVTLGADVTLTTTDSNVTFASTIDGTTDGGESLSIAAGSGVVTFGGVVGGATNKALESFGITSSNTGAAAISIKSITTNGAGGAQTYTGNVTLADNATLTTNNGNISFTATVDGAKNLTLAAGTGTVTFTGIVGGTTAPTGLTISSGTVDTSSAASAITIDGNLTLGAATGADAILNGGSRTIKVSGNWTKNTTGTFNYGTGTVEFTGTSTSTSTISGSNTFYNLTSTVDGKTIKMESSKTQTIKSNITLGTSSNSITLTNTTTPTTSADWFTLDIDVATPTVSNIAFNKTTIKYGRSTKDVRGIVDNGTSGNSDGAPVSTVNFFKRPAGTPYVWSGDSTANDNWVEADNWELGDIPPNADTSEISVPKGRSRYPELETDVTTGDIEIGDATTSTPAASVNINGKEFNVNNISGDGTIDFNSDSSSMVYVTGDWSIENIDNPGDFASANCGTVTFKDTATAVQSITTNDQTFPNITFENANGYALDGELISSGQITLYDGEITSSSDITITTDALSYKNGNEPSISANGGSGSVTIAPYTDICDIAIEDDDSFSLYIPAILLQNIIAANVTIGRADGAGSFYIGNEGTIDCGSTVYNLTLQSPDAPDSGAMAFSFPASGDTLQLASGKTLSLDMGAGNITSNSTADADITAETLVITAANDAGTSTNPLTTNINNLGASTLAGNLYLKETDDLHFSGATSVSTTSGTLSVDAGGAITQAAAITAKTGAIRAKAGITLTNTGNTISSLTLTNGASATAGNIQYINSAALTVASASNTFATGTISISASSGITLAGDISGTTGDITLTGAVTLDPASGAVITVSSGSGAGDIKFTGTIDDKVENTNGLSVTAGDGKVIFGGAVGGTTSIKELEVTSSNADDDAISIQSITTGESSGPTAGDQTFTGKVTLAADTTLTSNGGAISFSSTLDSDSTARSLTIAADAGTVTFGGEVGGTNAISNLTINSGTVDTSTSTSDITISGNLTLGAATGTTAVLNGGGGRTIKVSGNWTKNTTGTFNCNSGTVEFTGTSTSTSTISGSNIFYNLTSTVAGKTIVLPAQTTTPVTQTVSNKLTLSGGSGAGDDIKLTSSDTSSKTYKPTWFRLAVTAAAANVDVTWTTISYGESVNDLRGTGLVGDTAKNNNDGGATATDVSTVYFFKRPAGIAYVWSGASADPSTLPATTTNCAEPANWVLGDIPSNGDTAAVAQVPSNVWDNYPILEFSPLTIGSIEITASAASFDINGKTLNITNLKNDGTIYLNDSTINAVNITGNAAAAGGTLDFGSVPTTGTINVTGNWNVNTLANAKEGMTLTLKGTDDQSLTTNAQTFPAVVINNTGSGKRITLVGALASAGNITITKGEVYSAAGITLTSGGTTKTLTINDKITAAAGDIVLNADVLSYDTTNTPAISATTSYDVTIAPVTVSKTIGIEDSTGDLKIPALMLQKIIAKNVTIGNAAGAGNIYIGSQGTIELNSGGDGLPYDMTIQSPASPDTGGMEFRFANAGDTLKLDDDKTLSLNMGKAYIIRSGSGPADADITIGGTGTLIVAGANNTAGASSLGINSEWLKTSITNIGASITKAEGSQGGSIYIMNDRALNFSDSVSVIGTTSDPASLRVSAAGSITQSSGAILKGGTGIFKQTDTDTTPYTITLDTNENVFDNVYLDNVDKGAVKFKNKNGAATPNLTVSARSSGGDVTITETAGTLTVGTVNFVAGITSGNGSATTGGAVTLTAATGKAIVLSQTVSSAGSANGGNITFSNAVSLSLPSSGAVSVTSGNDGTGDITFSSTVDATYNGGSDTIRESLTVNAGTGSGAGKVSFGGAVGGTISLASLAVESANNAATLDAISIRNVTTGDTTPTAGAQAYTGNVILAADTTLTSNGGNISFSATVNSVSSGAKNLTLAAGTASATGSVTFTGIAGGVTALAAFTVTSGSVTLSEAAKLGSVTISATIAPAKSLLSGASGKTIEVSGNWANNSTTDTTGSSGIYGFIAADGTVEFTSTAANSTSVITGENTFYNLYSAIATDHAAIGKTIKMEAKKTQTVTNLLTLKGNENLPVPPNSHNYIKLTSNAGTPDKDDKDTWFILDVLKNTNTPPALPNHNAVSWATISYGQSVNDLRGNNLATDDVDVGDGTGNSDGAAVSTLLFFVRPANIAYVWLGASSANNNWMNADNWVLGDVPPNPGAAKVSVPKGRAHYPELETNVTIGDIEIGDATTSTPAASVNINEKTLNVNNISGDGTIDFNSKSASTVNVTGNWDISIIANFGTSGTASSIGTVTFNGTVAAQSITTTAQTFPNIILNNTYNTDGEFTLAGELKSVGTITLTKGNISSSSDITITTDSLVYDTTNKPAISATTAYDVTIAPYTASKDIRIHDNTTLTTPLDIPLLLLQNITAKGVIAGKALGTGNVYIGNQGTIESSAASTGLPYNLTIQSPASSSGSPAAMAFQFAGTNTLLLGGSTTLTLNMGAEGSITSTGATTTDITAPTLLIMGASSAAGAKNVGTSAAPLTTSISNLGASTLAGSLYLKNKNSIAFSGSVAVSTSTGGTLSVEAGAATDGAAVSITQAAASVLTGDTGIFIQNSTISGGAITLNNGTNPHILNNVYLKNASAGASPGATSFKNANVLATPNLNVAAQSAGGAVTITETLGTLTVDTVNSVSGITTGISSAATGGAITLGATAASGKNIVLTQTVSSAGDTNGGDITFSNAVSLSLPSSGAVSVTSGADGTGDITFSSTVDATYVTGTDTYREALTVNGGTGTSAGKVSFGGAVGGTIPLASLAVESANNAATLDAISIRNVTTGDTTPTAGAQTYTGNVILADNATLTSNGGNIGFSATVNSVSSGAKNLTLDAGIVSSTPGAVTFTGIVGGVTALGAFTVTSGSVTLSEAAKFGSVTISATIAPAKSLLSGASGKTIEVSGNWANNSTTDTTGSSGIYGFIAAGGTVEFTSTAANSTSVITGETTFYNLYSEITSTTGHASVGKTIKMAANKTQKVTNKLTLKGYADPLTPPYTTLNKITLTSDAATPDMTDTDTWFTLDVPKNTSPANYNAVSYTTISYGQSVNDLRKSSVTGVVDVGDGADNNDGVPVSTLKFFVRPANIAYVWQGDTVSSTNTDWDVKDNWVLGDVPPNSSAVTISIPTSKPTYPILDSSVTPVTVGTITIETGASIYIDGQTFNINTISGAGTIDFNSKSASTVNVTGDWGISNIANSGTSGTPTTIGSVTFKGTAAAQSITTNDQTFPNIILNNTYNTDGEFTLAGELKSVGTITLTTGNISSTSNITITTDSLSYDTGNKPEISATTAYDVTIAPYTASKDIRIHDNTTLPTPLDIPLLLLQNITAKGVIAGKALGTGNVYIGNQGTIESSIASTGLSYNLTIQSPASSSGSPATMAFQFAGTNTLLLGGSTTLTLNMGAEGSITSTGATATDITAPTLLIMGASNAAGAKNVGTSAAPLTTSISNLGASTLAGSLYLKNKNSIAFSGSVAVSTSTGGTLSVEAGAATDGAAVSITQAAAAVLTGDTGIFIQNSTISGGAITLNNGTNPHILNNVYLKNASAGASPGATSFKNANVLATPNLNVAAQSAGGAVTITETLGTLTVDTVNSVIGITTGINGAATGGAITLGATAASGKNIVLTQTVSSAGNANGGNITFSNAVSLFSSGAVSVTSGADGTGDITFNSTVDATYNGTTDTTRESLDVTPGTGTVIFAGAVGGTTDGALNILTIPSGTVKNSATGAALSITAKSLVLGVASTTSVAIDTSGSATKDITLKLDDLTQNKGSTVNAGTGTGAGKVSIAPLAANSTVEYGDAITASLAATVFYQSIWTSFTAGSFTVGNNATETIYISATGQDAIFSGNGVPYPLTLHNGSGFDIEFRGNYKSNGKAFTLEAGRNIIFDHSSSAAITVDLGAGKFTASSNVILKDQDSTDTITATGGVNFGILTTTPTAVNITSAEANTHNLKIIATGSAVLFNGDIGDTGNAIGDITIADSAGTGSGASDVSFNGKVFSSGDMKLIHTGTLTILDDITADDGFHQNSVASVPTGAKINIGPNAANTVDITTKSILSIIFSNDLYLFSNLNLYEMSAGVIETKNVYSEKSGADVSTSHWSLLAITQTSAPAWGDITVDGTLGTTLAPLGGVTFIGKDISVKNIYSAARTTAPLSLGDISINNSNTLTMNGTIKAGHSFTQTGIGSGSPTNELAADVTIEAADTISISNEVNGAGTPKLTLKNSANTNLSANINSAELILTGDKNNTLTLSTDKSFPGTVSIDYSPDTSVTPNVIHGVTLAGSNIYQADASSSLTVNQGYLDLANFSWDTGASSAAANSGYHGTSGSLTLGDNSGIAEIRTKYNFIIESGFIISALATSTIVMNGTGAGEINLKDSALQIIGSLDISGNSAAITAESDITLKGNWKQMNNFTHNSKTVTFIGDSSVSGGSDIHIIGNTTWWDFMADNTAGANINKIQFSNYPDQHTIGNDITIKGTVAQPITLYRETDSPAPPFPAPAPTGTPDESFWVINVSALKQYDFENLIVHHSWAYDFEIEPDLSVVCAPYRSSSGTSYYNIRWNVKLLYLVYSFTEDTNGDGRIDRLRLQSTMQMAGALSDFSIKVTGYEIDTAQGQNGYGIVGGNFPSDMLYAYLKPKSVPDTGERPVWTLESPGGIYAADNPSNYIETPPDFTEQPVDTAPPRISYSLTLTGKPNQYIKFTEKVNGLSGSYSPFGGKTITYSGDAGGGGYLFTLNNAFSAEEIAADGAAARYNENDVFITSNLIADTQPSDWPPIPTGVQIPDPKYPSGTPAAGTIEGMYSDYTEVDRSETFPGTILPSYPAFASNGALLLQNSRSPSWNNGTQRRVSDLLLLNAPPPPPDDLWPSYAKRDESGGPGENEIINQWDGSKTFAVSDFSIVARDAIILDNSPQLVFGIKVPPSFRENEASDTIWLPLISAAPDVALDIVPDTFAGTPLSVTDVKDFSGYKEYTHKIIGNEIRQSIAGNDFFNRASPPAFDFIYKIEGPSPPLYAVRANTAGAWYNDLKPFSFKLQDIVRQRGGATILNNVINPERGDKTMLNWTLAKGGSVNINVFTLDGKIVKTLFRGRGEAGDHYVEWDGKNNGGNIVARGIYFIRIVAPDIDEIRKVIVVK